MSTLTINFRPYPKQELAYQLLTNRTTTELLFGGGAGGGKSRLGCSWLILSCIQYPGTRWLMGRSKLKNLKESTLLTFFEVATDWEMKADTHYKYNQQDNIISLWNGSTIYLKDLFAYPADPNFDSLGSTEYTGAFIDEANQVTAKAKGIVSSRLRYKLADFNLIPKLLMTCNPAKNWVYADFYQPAKTGTLKPYRAFVQALVSDNPGISPYYIEELNKLDKASRERLLFGNWEYDDDPNALFGRDELTDLFSNPVERGSEKYLTCDVARFGRDKTVLIVWEGLVAIEIHVMGRSSGPEVEEAVEGLRAKHGIPMSHVLLDEDGVGGNAVDHLRCKGFINNSTPLQNPIEAKQTFKVNYANLKAQCYYTLADYVRNHKLVVAVDDSAIRDNIIADLEQVKAKNTDKDSKLRVLTKEEIKEHYGKSPDFGDALMMRMWFELDPTPVPRIF